MNVLTKNRILQKGDEYRNNPASEAGWTPVPKDNFGLQVQFTNYKEVRRPSEKPSLSRETPETDKDSRTEVPKRVVSPAPISQKQQGVRNDQAAQAEKEKTPVPTPSGTGELPTVVSIKAHSRESELTSASNGHIKIKFPNSGPVPIWTGRNGTFNGYGLEASTVGDMVLLYPVGKRGVGNCMIQFPVKIIPQLIDWLLKATKINTL